MRAAIYARVSTKDKGQTNETQLRELRDFAQRLGYSIYKEYTDQKAAAAPSGLSSNSSLPMRTSGALTWCCSGPWTVLAGRA